MRLLLDENVEKALLTGLRRHHPGLDVVRVVDVGLGGRSDPEILEWAAREGRVVVSRDRATLSAEAARRIEGGKPRLPVARAHQPPVLVEDLLQGVESGEGVVGGVPVGGPGVPGAVRPGLGADPHHLHGEHPVVDSSRPLTTCSPR